MLDNTIWEMGLHLKKLEARIKLLESVEATGREYLHQQGGKPMRVKRARLAFVAALDAITAAEKRESKQ